MLGATGNVYDVTITLQPSCTCPDFAKGHHCKHLFFVYCKVLKLARDDDVIWQRHLLQSELQRILSQRCTRSARVCDLETNRTVSVHRLTFHSEACVLELSVGLCVSVGDKDEIGSNG